MKGQIRELSVVWLWVCVAATTSNISAQPVKKAVSTHHIQGCSGQVLYSNTLEQPPTLSVTVTVTVTVAGIHGFHTLCITK
ncbi:hypothetical protein E2C01_034526 [Portunus trituberculatus]|uniref:Uncharacterized protein n=1 Tax=Portunus trituberculatus TaxID=210409 RepID=A0A5B7F6W3_PORTR|nr:hypothetical protein [Portunus trituberculatus]